MTERKFGRGYKHDSGDAKYPILRKASSRTYRYWHTRRCLGVEFQL